MFRRVVMQSRLLVVHGYVQRDVDVIHVVAERLEDRSDALLRLSPEGMTRTVARANVVERPLPARGGRHPRNVEITPPKVVIFTEGRVIEEFKTTRTSGATPAASGGAPAGRKGGI